MTLRTALFGLSAIALLGGCRVQETSGNEAAGNAASTVPATEMSLTRLDCGHAEFKDMNGFFSDKPGVYPPGPGKVVDSCYLIRHGKDLLLWDTGLPLSTLQKPMEQNGMTGALTVALTDQLAKLGIKPADITIVGISHMHGDHTGQASQFPNAKLLIGKRDFEQTAGKDDPFGPWRGAGKNVELVTADTDVFGDGSVTTLYLPGHTPDHMGLKVDLASGPVILSGDTFHSTIAREKRSVPGFNTDRAQSVASMDRLDKIVNDTHARLIIQHEPADVAKLPAFPASAK
jgi:glyoxylase-like metal-dependent hydrolase (beta-lactamase superfamily II)